MKYTDHYLDISGNDFGYPMQTIVDQIKYFDPYRLPDLENAPEGLIGHLFMSRPAFNLNDTNIEILRSSPRTAAFFTNPVTRSLLYSMSSESPSRWLPLIYKKAKTYSVNDYEIKAAEKGGTYYGHTIRYGIHSEESKFGGTLSIDFRNDKEHSILWMMYIWMQYIHIISSNRAFKPLDYYQKNAIIDYASSLYYIITDRSGRKIIYWEKILGIFPTKSPLSIFSWNDDVITQDTVSIDFTYGFRSDPMDYDVLIDFMAVSGFINNSQITTVRPDRYKVNGETMNIGHPNEFVRRDDLAKVPVIYRLDDRAAGSSTFNLGWYDGSRGMGNTFSTLGATEYGNLPTSEASGH